LSMKRDGYEADKQDIVVKDWNKKKLVSKLNLTAHWDETVNSFLWSEDGKHIYYNAAWRGTVQLFSVSVPSNLLVKSLPVIKQVSDGVFDVSSLIGVSGDKV